MLNSAKGKDLSKFPLHKRVALGGSPNGGKKPKTK